MAFSYLRVTKVRNSGPTNRTGLQSDQYIKISTGPKPDKTVPFNPVPIKSAKAPNKTSATRAAKLPLSSPLLLVFFSSIYLPVFALSKTGPIRIGQYRSKMVPTSFAQSFRRAKLPLFSSSPLHTNRFLNGPDLDHA